MFYLVYSKKGITTSEYFNDIKTLQDTILCLLGEKEAKEVERWCSRARFGIKVHRAFQSMKISYDLQCINEVDMEKDLIAVADIICKPFDMSRSQAFWDGNTDLTVDLEPGLSWIKFNHNRGYYIVLNKMVNGEYRELFSTVNKDKKKFIEDAIKGINKSFPEYAKMAASKGLGCKFIVGHTYMGRCEKTLKDISIIITKRTPQFVFYETDTGIAGRAMVKLMGKNEAIMIDKVDKLFVNSAHKWS